MRTSYVVDLRPVSSKTHGQPLQADEAVAGFELCILARQPARNTDSVASYCWCWTELGDAWDLPALPS